MIASRFRLSMLVLMAFLPAPCSAADWLVLLVDRSNSIDDRELDLQRDAYIRLLSDDAVAQALADTRIAIVEFDTEPQIVVTWTDAISAARAYGAKAPDGPRGQTGIGDAMAIALALLAGKRGRAVIDISGDGRENVDAGLLSDVRAAASHRAIEVNGLAIVTPENPDIDDYYRDRVVNGFVLAVRNRRDFYAALRQKLFYEVSRAPPAAPSFASRPFKP